MSLLSCKISYAGVDDPHVINHDITKQAQTLDTCSNNCTILAIHLAQWQCCRRDPVIKRSQILTKPKSGRTRSPQSEGRELRGRERRRAAGAAKPPTADRRANAPGRKQAIITSVNRMPATGIITSMCWLSSSTAAPPALCLFGPREY